MRPDEARPPYWPGMKMLVLLLLAAVSLVASSCSVRGHANKSSTGAGVSTPVGGVDAAVRY
jgi:hypothetical protein